MVLCMCLLHVFNCPRGTDSYWLGTFIRITVAAERMDFADFFFMFSANDRPRTLSGCAVVDTI